MSGEELPPELQNQIAIAAADAADTLHKIDEAKADVLNNERGGDEASEILNRELDIKEASTELQHFQAMERIKEQQHKRKLDDENRDLDRQFRERQLQVTDENKDLDRAQRERQMALNAAAAAAKKQGQN
jgi:predicted transcriptional regulator YheO